MKVNNAVQFVGETHTVLAEVVEATDVVEAARVETPAVVVAAVVDANAVRAKCQYRDIHA